MLVIFTDTFPGKEQPHLGAGTLVQSHYPLRSPPPWQRWPKGLTADLPLLRRQGVPKVSLKLRKAAETLDPNHLKRKSLPKPTQKTDLYNGNQCTGPDINEDE